MKSILNQRVLNILILLFFPEKVVNNDIFVYLCLYDYQPLVKTFLSTRKINIESIAIINR